MNLCMENRETAKTRAFSGCIYYYYFDKYFDVGKVDIYTAIIARDLKSNFV